MSIHRPDLPLSGEHSLPGGHYRIRRCQRCGIVIGYGERCDFCVDRPADYVEQPGDYFGRHHTEWVATVDELIVQGDEDSAEFLLLRLIDAVETEVALTRVAPYERHFARLAQIARRRRDEKVALRVEEQYAQCRRAALAPPAAEAG